LPCRHGRAAAKTTARETFCTNNNKSSGPSSFLQSHSFAIYYPIGQESIGYVNDERNHVNGREMVIPSVLLVRGSRRTVRSFNSFAYDLPRRKLVCPHNRPRMALYSCKVEPYLMLIGLFDKQWCSMSFSRRWSSSQCTISSPFMRFVIRKTLPTCILS
jgi:hypothetical protein